MEVYMSKVELIKLLCSRGATMSQAHSLAIYARAVGLVRSYGGDYNKMADEMKKLNNWKGRS